MARSLRSTKVQRGMGRQAPPPLDPENLPRRATRGQLAELHQRLYGPMSARTLERLPLASQIVGGRALYDTREFLAWAEDRLASALVVAGRKPVRRAQASMRGRMAEASP